MSARGWSILCIATVAVLLLLGRTVTALVVDHAWFLAMGVPSIWWERTVDTVLLQGGACLAGTLFAFANLHAVRRTILAVAVPSRVANIEVTAMIPARRLLIITLALSAIVGVGLAAPFTDWTEVAMARHGIAFGEIEGFLDRDLGFYVYWLPLEETLYVWSLVSVVTVGTMVLVLYTLTRSVRLEGRHVIASSHARRHVGALGALVLLLLAWSYRLDSFDLLRSGSGPDGLFVRVDHMITLRVDLLMSAMCALGALLLLRAAWLGQVRLAFITLSLVLAGALGLRHLLPAVLSRGTLLGEPTRRDADYVATRTLVSRRAYDVDAIRTASPESVSTFGSRVRRGDLARAVSLWDASTLQARALEASRGALLPSRPAWLANDNGSLSALIVRRPGSSGERWTITMLDATQPGMRDSVIDLATEQGDSEISAEPVVAPGLHGHRLTPDPAGVVLGTALRTLRLRIAHAWAARDLDLLEPAASGDPARVYVSVRDVRERVSMLAPVFAQGDEVLPLLHDGVLYWTLNLYSSSGSYPLSQQWQIGGEARSYFRLAATALVESSTGRVRLVASMRPDPIARTWMAHAPDLFVRPSDLPAGLVDRLPPATEGSIAQLRTFARYGSRMEGTVPRHTPDSTLAGDGPPAHLLGTDSATVVAWSVPLLGAGEQLDGVMTAIGGRHRSMLWDSTTVPRRKWSALAEPLRQALDSTRALSSDGSRRELRMRPGRVRVVMTDRGPLLAQPLQWNRADGSAVISRVGVAYEGRIGTGATIAEAIAHLGSSGGRVIAAVEQPLTSAASRDARLNRLYEVMRQSMRAGNWTRFGAAFDSLGKALSKP